MDKFYKFLTVMILVIMTGFTTTSCSDDDDKEKKANIAGKWEYSDSSTSSGSINTVRMVLTFNSDKTGSIDETWSSQSRASMDSHYNMKFSWATTTDSNGNDILKISYVSGDKETELFPGNESTVLWTRQYVLTGKILNIYSGSSSVWVFNKK